MEIRNLKKLNIKDENKYREYHENKVKDKI